MANNAQAKLEKLMSFVAEQGGSDLHLDPGKPPIIRVDRKLIEVSGESVMSSEDTLEAAKFLLGDERYKIFEKNREFDFSYAYGEKARFRINTYYKMGSVAIAMRLIPRAIRTIEELGLPSVIKQFAKAAQGLVIVVGPSGHGKSTTLASLIDIINHERADHIITIEDPIEYIFTPDKSLIAQREVNHDTNSFSNALKSVLREDANVVMVGEMRDLETISTTITVAETGHLVFATLHTNDAAQTIDRMIDVFPPYQQNQVRSQLANIITGVVSQRLLPKLGGGRMVVTEIMFATPAIRNLIREGKTYQINSVIQTSAEEGMISMDKSLSELVRAEKISMDSALMYAMNKDSVLSMLKS